MSHERSSPPPFVSRAGLKLDHAIAELGVTVAGRVCADFGCHAGGFTDCLLRRGAARVYAVDTGWGVLDHRLRTDPRVVVRERTNVLYCKPPAEAVDLVAIDLAWTRQHRSIPVALKWLAPQGRIVTLVKPNYEVTDEEKGLLAGGTLDPEHAAAVFSRLLDQFPALGADVLASTASPIPGAKSARRRRGEGNREYLVLLAKAASR